MRHLLAPLLLLTALCARAQDDAEYRMEIGGAVGLVSYVGDFNGSPFGGMKPAFSAIWRYLFNPYMGLRASATYGKLAGDNGAAESYMPEAREPYAFSNTLFDLGLVYEYNFWPYGTGRDYRGAKRLTPYVFGGLGVTAVGGSNGGSGVFTANLPLGLGVKYKAAARLNIGLEWQMHFSLSDRLDGVADPYGVPSSGMFKNADGYAGLRLWATYSFKAKCRTCHKE